MRPQSIFQGDLQTVGQKRNQDLRVGAMLELMMNGADEAGVEEGLRRAESKGKGTDDADIARR